MTSAAAALLSVTLLVACSSPDDQSSNADDDAKFSDQGQPTSAPVTLTVEPSAVEPCGEAVTIFADVSVPAGTFVKIRLVPTEGDLRSEDIQDVRMSEAMSPLRLDLFVGPGYSEDRDTPPQREVSPGTVLGTPVTPVRGEHVVTVEMNDEVVAKGSVTVLPENPDTPTRCHSGAN